MIQIQMGSIFLHVEEKLELSEIVKMNKEVESYSEFYFFIKVYDLNEKWLFDKLIPYDSIRPQIIFFDKNNFFAIKYDKCVDFCFWNSKEIKVTGSTTAVQIISRKDCIIIIFEAEIKKLTYSLTEILSDSLSDLIQDFYVDEKNNRIVINTFNAQTIYYDL